MAADDPMMRIRLPPELKAQVEKAAEAENRSMNAEIVTRLQASFATSSPPGYAGVLPGLQQLIETTAEARALQIVQERMTGGKRRGSR